MKYESLETEIDMVKTAEKVVGVDAVEIFRILKIKDLKSFENKRKFFNFVLSKAKTDYTGFSIRYRHLLRTKKLKKL